MMLSLLCFLLSLNAGASNFDAQLQALQALSKANGKPILLKFGAPWCKPCLVFDKDTESEPLKSGIESVHYLSVNTNDHQDVAMQYSALLLPTYVLLTAEGGLLGRFGGYGKPEPFLETLDLMTRNPQTIEERIKEFEKIPSLDSAIILAHFYETANEMMQSLNYWTYAHKENPEGKFFGKIVDIKRYSLGKDPEVFSLQEVVDDAFLLFELPASSIQQKLNVAKFILEYAQESGNDDFLPPLKDQITRFEATLDKQN